MIEKIFPNVYGSQPRTVYLVIVVLVITLVVMGVPGILQIPHFAGGPDKTYLEKTNYYEFSSPHWIGDPLSFPFFILPWLCLGWLLIDVVGLFRPRVVKRGWRAVFSSVIILGALAVFFAVLPWINLYLPPWYGYAIPPTLVIVAFVLQALVEISRVRLADK